jgi:protein arginine kinase
MAKNQNNKNSALASLHAPWDSNENMIWLASTIRTSRNIEKFKFPHKMESERKEHLLQLTSKPFLASKTIQNPFLLKVDELSPQEKEFLIEHFLLSEGFQEAQLGSGVGINASGEVIALFNIKDHVQLQYTDTHGDLEMGYSVVTKLEKEIGETLNFAFNEQFGFLTSDPTHAGTGLLVSCYLHLPALIHTETLKETEKHEGVLATGLQGNPDELVGDILMLRNLYTLGINEETILSSMRACVMQHVVSEKSARAKIKEQKTTLFVDLISRACGSLKYAHQIEAQEALSQLSLIKLGLELGWVKGLTIKEVNSLFFDCRRSHLAYLLNEKAKPEEIAAKRADYLRKKTADLILDFG